MSAADDYLSNILNDSEGETEEYDVDLTALEHAELIELGTPLVLAYDDGEDQFVHEFQKMARCDECRVYLTKGFIIIKGPFVPSDLGIEEE